MNADRLTLVDATGKQVAEMAVRCDEAGWFFGEILASEFSPKLKEALDRYDDVVENQMLSFLDTALADVEQFGLCVRSANGISHRVYSLQINKQNEALFRTTPVPPPAWLSKSESA
jgi:hypothetical protein